MTREDVVVDASPLIVLIKSDLEYLLPLVFSNVFVTRSVYEEVLAGPENDRAAERIPDLPWLIKIPKTKVSEKVLDYELGRGESETLSTALGKAGCRAMLDDAAARKCASQLGIPTIGTGGFLALATRRGHLDRLDKALQSVRSSGLWISDSLIDTLLSRDRTN